MIIVKVTYTVKSSFAEKNQENIQLFIDDFKQMNDGTFRYNAYVCGDGKTFVHLSHYDNEHIQSRLLATPSFVSFQEQRDESGLEGTPQVEVMKLVACSHDIL
jgi:predicted acetyltransferase